MEDRHHRFALLGIDVVILDFLAQIGGVKDVLVCRESSIDLDHLGCHKHHVGDVGGCGLITGSVFIYDKTTEDCVENEEEEGDAPEYFVETIDHMNAFEANGREFLESFADTLIVGGLAFGDVKIVDQHIFTLNLDEVEGEEGTEGDEVDGKTGGVEMVGRVHIFRIGTNVISTLLGDEEDEERGDENTI